VKRCNFSTNRNVNFIKVESEREIYIPIHTMIIPITVTNAMTLLKDTVVTNNTNYNAIVTLQSSLLLLKVYIEASSNHVRQVLIARLGSYPLIMEKTKLNIL